MTTKKKTTKRTNRVGRPPTDTTTKQRVLWLTDEADEKLNELARERQTSRSDIASCAIMTFEHEGAEIQDLKDKHDAQKETLDAIRALVNR